MKEPSIYELASDLGRALQRNNWSCAVAESCTGGGLAAAITEIAGSSSWFDCGIITYSNQAKQKLLAVPEQTLMTHGAVSEATVCAMAQGVFLQSDANVSLSISGIAGPGGGSEDKPLGTVWLGWAVRGEPSCAKRFLFTGGRQNVREQAVIMALKTLTAFIDQQ